MQQIRLPALLREQMRELNWEEDYKLDDYCLMRVYMKKFEVRNPKLETNTITKI